MLAEMIRDFSQDEAVHKLWIARVEEAYEAYEGLLREDTMPARYMSRQHPPYVLQVIETLSANIIDPNPTWRVSARPRLDEDGDRLEELIKGARAHELLLSQQATEDGFDQKQSAFVKQGLIAGLSVYKTFWRFEERERTRSRMRSQDVLSDNGTVIGSVDIPERSSKLEVTADNPSVEVVDVRDFIWHESATSLEKAQRVTHRVWMTIDELRELGRRGVYENVDKVKPLNSQLGDDSSSSYRLFGANRTKDMVEVLEMWRRGSSGISVTSVANRNVLLRNRPSPFDHGELPFITATPIEGRFVLYGIGIAEIIRDIQMMLWTLQNARIDNVQFLNSFIMVMRDSVTTDDKNYEPGAIWHTEDPQNDVRPLQVSPLPAQISIGAENSMKEDLQNIPGASPSLLGQFGGGRLTATEVSLVTSLAQRRVAWLKHVFQIANKRVGEQWMSMNKQFMDTERAIQSVGPGGRAIYETFSPGDLQGEFHIQIDGLDRSLIRQERKAEATSKFQVALQAAPVFASLAQAGLSPMINLRAFMEDVLDADDVPDKERYFLPSQQGMPPGQLPASAPPAQGVTSGNGAGAAPQSVDFNSPSNQFSQSPVAALQRMLASSGGPSNA